MTFSLAFRCHPLLSFSSIRTNIPRNRSLMVRGKSRSHIVFHRGELQTGLVFVPFRKTRLLAAFLDDYLSSLIGVLSLFLKLLSCLLVLLEGSFLFFSFSGFAAMVTKSPPLDLIPWRLFSLLWIFCPRDYPSGFAALVTNRHLGLFPLSVGGGLKQIGSPGAWRLFCFSEINSARLHHGVPCCISPLICVPNIHTLLYFSFCVHDWLMSLILLFARQGRQGNNMDQE